MTEDQLQRALATVLDDCLAIRPSETVLVVTDPGKRAIADALVDAARERGAEAVVAEMSERATHGTEPPGPIAAAMLSSNVVIAPTSKSISHTAARKAANENGARIATMPDITEDMLSRTMSADFGEVARRSAVVADALSQGTSVRVTSPQGTDVSFDISGREGLSDDGRIVSPGDFGNLPAGEGFVAPVEGATKGRIVFDGSIWPIGLLEEHLVVEIDHGYITDIAGPRAEDFRSLLEPQGKDAFAVAELGIGTNEAARLTGNVLEDEKILGTIHVAFGDNHSFGGVIRVASHQDGIVVRPTLEIDGTVLVDDGTLLA